MKNLIVEPYIFARKDQLEKARKAGHLVACFGKPEYGDMIALYSQSSIDALRDEINALPQWQPIETAPEHKCVDMWVKSHDNPNFGRRAVDVAKVDGKWYGCNLLPDSKYGEYASHWMPLPAGPK